MTNYQLANGSQLGDAACVLFGSPTPSIEGTGAQPAITDGTVETRYAGPRRPTDGQGPQGALRMITDRQMVWIQRATNIDGRHRDNTSSS